MLNNNKKINIFCKICAMIVSILIFIFIILILKFIKLKKTIRQSQYNEIQIKNLTQKTKETNSNIKNLDTNINEINTKIIQTQSEIQNIKQYNENYLHYIISINQKFENLVDYKNSTLLCRIQEAIIYIEKTIKNFNINNICQHTLTIAQMIKKLQEMIPDDLIQENRILQTYDYKSDEQNKNKFLKKHDEALNFYQELYDILNNNKQITIVENNCLKTYCCNSETILKYNDDNDDNNKQNILQNCIFCLNVFIINFNNRKYQ